MQFRLKPHLKPFNVNHAYNGNYSFFLYFSSIRLRSRFHTAAFSRCLFASRAESLYVELVCSQSIFLFWYHSYTKLKCKTLAFQWANDYSPTFEDLLVTVLSTRSWMNQCRRSEQSDSSEVSGFVQSVCYKICKTCSVWVQLNIVSLMVPSYLFISEQYMTSVLCNRFTCSCSRIAPCSLVNFCSNSFRSWWEDKESLINKP